MKNISIIILIITISSTLSSNAQGWWKFSLGGSVVIFNDWEINNLYGAVPMLKLGIEKQLLSRFGLEAAFKRGGRQGEFSDVGFFEVSINPKYFWFEVEPSKPNIYTGVVGKVARFSTEKNSSKNHYSTLCLGTLVGFEIPIQDDIVLDLGWNSSWGKVMVEEEKIRIDNEIFYLSIVMAF